MGGDLLYTYDELSGDSNAILKWSGAPRFLGSNRCLYNSFQIYCGGVCAGNIRLLRMGADRRLLRCGCHDCTEELNGDGMTYGPAVSMYYNIVRSPGNFSINAVLDSLKKVHRYPYRKSYKQRTPFTNSRLRTHSTALRARVLPPGIFPCRCYSPRL